MNTIEVKNGSRRKINSRNNHRFNFLKGLVAILLITVILFSVILAPITIKGYKIYKSALEEKSIEDIVKEIKGTNGYIPLENISEDFIDELVKVEDRRFHYHLGFDPISILRALYYNIKSDEIVQGGSTITQQLAKNLWLSFDKKYERKMAEIFLAVNLELKLTKDDILELYSNIIYFGEGKYGINEASNYYYGVDAKGLSKEQSIALVRTLKSPNNYNPNSSK